MSSIGYWGLLAGMWIIIRQCLVLLLFIFWFKAVQSNLKQNIGLIIKQPYAVCVC